MHDSPWRATTRFSGRVENYVRYRPGYPAQVVTILADQAGLARESIVADVGSGTGISTRLFLDSGNVVYAVEPNQEMRAAAETLLRGYSTFHGVAGTAEATGLAAGSVDFVVAGQAFHWFDVPRARREFLRILRPRGWAVLMWNTRRTDTTAFLRGYESLLNEFGTDYQEVNHAHVTKATLRGFFGDSPPHCRKLPNEQVFDFEGLTGRLLSSSYVPAEGDSRYGPMLQALAALFATHQKEGRVRFEYDTELYFGRLE